MKTILKTLFILAIFISTNYNAQNNDYPKPGDVFYNPNFDKYVGTWKWQDGNKSLTVIFKKVFGEYGVIENINGDMLIGYHEFRENGLIVESSLPFVNYNISQKKYSIIDLALKIETNFVNPGWTHISKNKSIMSRIEFIDSTHIKIVSFKNYRRAKISTPTFSNDIDPSISLPSNIVLTKQ